MSNEQMHKEIMNELKDLNTRVSRIEGKIWVSAAVFSTVFGLLGAFIK